MQKEKIRNVPSIEELRAAGHKVRVYHARHFKQPSWDETWVLILSKKEMAGHEGRNYYDISCKGGYTRIDVTTMNGKEYSAKFNVPAGHNFNRKRGIRACIGRIIKQWGQE